MEKLTRQAKNAHEPKAIMNSTTHATPFTYCDLFFLPFYFVSHVQISQTMHAIFKLMYVKQNNLIAFSILKILCQL
jgi:hypothetical protein